MTLWIESLVCGKNSLLYRFLHVDYSTVTTKLSFECARENSHAIIFLPESSSTRAALNAQNASVKMKILFRWWRRVVEWLRACMREGKMWQLQFECKWLSKYFSENLLYGVNAKYASQSFDQGLLRKFEEIVEILTRFNLFCLSPRNF